MSFDDCLQLLSSIVTNLIFLILFLVTCSVLLTLEEGDIELLWTFSLAKDPELLNEYLSKIIPFSESISETFHLSVNLYRENTKSFRSIKTT